MNPDYALMQSMDRSLTMICQHLEGIKDIEAEYNEKVLNKKPCIFCRIKSWIGKK